MEVCHVEMEGYWNTTDQFGIVNFTDFKILKGPEGLYTFKVATQSKEYVESEIFWIYIRTSVGQIII